MNTIIDRKVRRDPPEFDHKLGDLALPREDWALYSVLVVAQRRARSTGRRQLVRLDTSRYPLWLLQDVR